jgi:transposase-like protein
MAFTDMPNSLREFTERFSSEEACAKYLFECRWPTGFICPRCGTTKSYPIEIRAKRECANPKCRYQVSITAGTIMHRTKQDLVTWFHAAYLVSTLTPGISAVQFQRQLGISRYETAFTMLHKLRSAMVAPGRGLLHAEVEVDDGYIGGKESGRPGRGALNKALVVGAVELVRWTDKKSGKDRVRTGRARLKTIPDASAESLLPFVRESVEKGAIVHTDGWPSYMALANEGYDHRPVIQGEERECLLHIHRIFSNVKIWLLGTHHGRVSKKHLQAYLNEYTFRFNRRFWRGPAFHRALGLASRTAHWPTNKSLYRTGKTGGWIHPNAPAAKSLPALPDSDEGPTHGLGSCGNRISM